MQKILLGQQACAIGVRAVDRKFSTESVSFPLTYFTGLVVRSVTS